MNDSIEKVTKEYVAFCQQRDWEQFHNLKDVALSLTLEAAEVLEHFQWKSNDEIEAYIDTHTNEIADELADVFHWTLLLAHYLNIDLYAASDSKMKVNAEKYPLKKSKGRATKYNKL